jgi:hypothetical protein
MGLLSVLLLSAVTIQQRRCGYGERKYVGQNQCQSKAVNKNIIQMVGKCCFSLNIGCLGVCLSVCLTVWMSEFDRILFCLSVLCLEFVPSGDVTGKSERI